MVRAFAIAALPAMAASHGALVHPLGRNAVDRFEKPTGLMGITCGPGHDEHGDTWAWCQNLTGEACNNGQSSFWYSQGCFIGCDECDHVSGRRQTDLCKKGFVGKLPHYAISVNRGVTRDSPYDIFRHNPWRAPGYAPVADACGLAGGTPWGAYAPEEGCYLNTTHAKHGMRGSDLPEMPTGTVWQAGGEAEVVMTMRFNHGGGYAYRLCPASETLTEKCFQSQHLDFVRDKQALLFANGSRLSIQGTFVDVGTSPPGATWSRYPIATHGLGPRCQCNMDNDYHPGDFDCGCKKGEEQDGCTTPGNCSSGACLPCPETPGSDCSRCGNPPASPADTFDEPCDHDCLRQRPSVLDVVKVPLVAPGKYVLGFRLDCDATAQVWSNCADIIIESNDGKIV